MSNKPDKVAHAYIRIDIAIAVNLLKEALEKIGVDVKAAIEAIHAEHVYLHYGFYPDTFRAIRISLANLSEAQAKQLKASYDTMDVDEKLMMWYSLSELTLSVSTAEIQTMPDVMEKLQDLVLDAEDAYEQRTGHRPSITNIPDIMLSLEAAQRIEKRYPRGIPSLFDEV